MIIFLAVSAPAEESANAVNQRDARLAKAIRANQTLNQVHQMAQDLLKSGLNAGSSYNEVWIRDLNTFIEIALEVNPPEHVREALLTFLKFQGPGGDIVDGYVAVDSAKVKYAYRTSPLAPGLMAHKNTVETDQESSFVQAVSKYVSVTGDRTILQERVDGVSVSDRLGRALQYVLTERFDEKHKLVWGATRADWGDIQPEATWGVVVDANSHRALCIYDNAMLLIAINDYLQLLGPSTPETVRWMEIRDRLKQNIRKFLWDGKNQKFFSHVYLGGSPFPKDFNENAIYYHGGTAVAIEAGLLTRAEVSASLEKMKADVRAAGAASIGLTMYPPYPENFFKNSGMGPYNYQNGGDWSWFGGRMVRELIKRGYIAEAYRELQPMVERVKRTGGFHEWWTPDNQPRGSADFRGSAGVLGRDIELLQDWAKQH
jgi:glycogen debranching enzyme